MGETRDPLPRRARRGRPAGRARRGRHGVRRARRVDPDGAAGGHAATTRSSSSSPTRPRDAALAATVEALRGHRARRSRRGDAASMRRARRASEATVTVGARRGAASSRSTATGCRSRRRRRWSRLGEGGTPLVESALALRAAPAREVWLKVEGANPTGSFKDRGMTVAISNAVEEGARRSSARRPATPRRRRRRTPSRAGLTRVVLVPHGQDRRRASWRRRSCTARRSCRSRAASTTACGSPASSPTPTRCALVNSVNPTATGGPEDRRLRDRRRPRRRARRARPAGRQRRQHHRRTGRATASTPRPGAADRRRGCGASRPRARRRSCAASRSLAARDGRDRDPRRQPGLLAAGDGGARRVRRPDRVPSPTSRSCPRSATLPREEGVFVEPASAAGVAGLLELAAAGPGARRLARRVHRHRPRLKDIDTALRRTTVPCVDDVVDADVARGAPALAWAAADRRRGRPRPSGPVPSRPGDQRQPRPRLRQLRARALDLYDERRRPGVGRRASRRGRRARAPARCRATRRTWWCAPCARGVRRARRAVPGLRLHAAQPIPHGRGLGSSAAAIVAGLVAAQALVDDGDASDGSTPPCSRWRPSSRVTRTTSPPACSAGSRSPGRRPDGAAPSASSPTVGAVAARARPSRLPTETARSAAAGAGAARRRRVNAARGRPAGGGADRPTRAAAGGDRGPAAPAATARRRCPQRRAGAGAAGRRARGGRVRGRPDRAGPSPWRRDRCCRCPRAGRSCGCGWIASGARVVG